MSIQRIQLQHDTPQHFSTQGDSLTLLSGPEVVWVRAEFKGGRQERVVLARGRSISFSQRFEKVELSLPATAWPSAVENCLVRVGRDGSTETGEVRDPWPRSYFASGVDNPSSSGIHCGNLLSNARGNAVDVMAEVHRIELDHDPTTTLLLNVASLIGTATLPTNYTLVQSAWPEWSNDYFSTGQAKESVCLTLAATTPTVIPFTSIYLMKGAILGGGVFEPKTPIEIPPGYALQVTSVSHTVGVTCSFHWSEHTPDYPIET